VATAGASAVDPGLLAEAGAGAGEAVRCDPHGVAQNARAVADALAACAAERGAAVIVVGSRGQSARREILLGSVAMAALHQAPRGVRVVPDPHRFARGSGPTRRVGRAGNTSAAGDRPLFEPC
jgi:nucleotide-binding universal stress UspA family protein